MADTTFTDYTTPVVAAWLNDVNDHVYNDTPVSPATAVHDAALISNTPAGNIAATTVQAAINELDTEKVPLAGTGATGTWGIDISGNAATASDAAAHISDTTAAHDASAIANIAAGNIVATDVQAAINELDTEKAALASATFTGPVLFDVPADIAAAATVDLTGIGSGAVVSITGNTPISAFAMNDGQFVTCVAAGAFQLTYHATTNKIDGGVSVPLAVGYTFDLWKKGSVIYTRVHPSTATSTATAVCGTSGTITLASNTISYMKDGGRVDFSGYIDVSSVSSPTGTLTINTGIPYTSANNTRNISAVALRMNGTAPATGLIWQARIDQNSSDIVITYYGQDSGAEGTNAASLIAGGTSITFSGHFFTE